MKNEYLEAFCNAISDEGEIKQTCFSLLYETSITHFTPYLESEIMENLLLLPSEKKEDYINFAIDKINKTPYRNIDKSILDKWLVKYNVDLSTFPKFPNEELTNVLKTYYNGYLFNTHKEQHYIMDIQIDFYCYAAMLEAEKMVDFLDSKKNKPNISVDKSKKSIKKTSDISKDFENLDPYLKLQFLFEKLAEVNLKIKEESEEIEDVFELIEVENKYKKEILNLKGPIPDLMDELYFQSQKENIYYFDCPSEVYKSHHLKRLQDYLKEVPDANELDFLKSEIKYFSSPFENRLIKAHDYSEFIINNDRYKISLIRKLEFLAPKLNKHGYKITYREDSFLDDPFFNPDAIGTLVRLEKKKLVSKVDDEQNLEPKTEKQLTTNQIVLLLQEVGFFTHPKIEKATKKRQSELISKICGLNSKNIKTHIQKLDKKPSELGDNYQKDIDKIDDILNNLE